MLQLEINFHNRIFLYDFCVGIYHFANSQGQNTTISPDFRRYFSLLFFQRLTKPEAEVGISVATELLLK